jgi:hypothetical protein
MLKHDGNGSQREFLDDVLARWDACTVDRRAMAPETT